MSTYLPDPNVAPISYDNCPGFLEQYMRYLEINKGLRPLTLNNTASNLREFCQYTHIIKTQEYPPDTLWNCKQAKIINMPISEIVLVTTEDINNYLCFLSDVSGLSAATLKKKLCFIRKFYAYLLMMQKEMEFTFPAGNPTDGIFIPDAETPPTCDPLSVQQLHHLAICSRQSDNFRDHLVFMIFATTGITLSELVALNMGDIVTAEWLRVRCNRRGDYRYVYLPINCQQAMVSYLAEFRKRHGKYNDKTPMFCSTKQKRVTGRTIRNAVSRVGVLAGMSEAISPRLLRDSVFDILTEHHRDSFASVVPEYFGYTIYYRYGNMENPSARHKKFNNAVREMIISSPLNDIGMVYTEAEEVIESQPENAINEGEEHGDA